MRDQWLAMEHYRLHSVEAWPDSPRKEGLLRAIRSTIQSLSRGSEDVGCHACADTRRFGRGIATFPRPVMFDAPERAAA